MTPNTMHLVVGAVGLLAVLAAALLLSSFAGPNPDCAPIFLNRARDEDGTWRYDVVRVDGNPPAARDIHYVLTSPDSNGSLQMRASGNLSEPGALTFTDNAPQDGRVRVGDSFHSSEREGQWVALYEGTRFLGGTGLCY